MLPILWICAIHMHFMSLQWRHNVHDGVSNHRRFDCLLNRLFRRRSKKTSKICVTVLCEGDSLVTGEFPRKKGQWRGKCSHFKTSLYEMRIPNFTAVAQYTTWHLCDAILSRDGVEICKQFLSRTGNITHPCMYRVNLSWRHVHWACFWF